MASKSAAPTEYSDPDQPARFAAGKEANLLRMMDLDAHGYDGPELKDKRVLVTGGNRGLGLALVKELVALGADVIVTVRKPDEQLAAMGVQVVDGIDVTDNGVGKKLASALEGSAPLDVVVNNAGYFMEPVEKLGSLDFGEEIKMVDICAMGPLRITEGLHQAGLIKPQGGKVAMITSQGGSIAWRTTQCPDGGDYGHHMSKAAANMAGMLLAQELKSEGIIVTMLHPGFNRTDMTSKYSEIWDIEGAVDSSIGAKRVCHEIALMSPDRIGLFINCEDGLLIPW